VIGFVSKPADDTPGEPVTRAAVLISIQGNAMHHRKSSHRDLNGAHARKRLMLGVLALIAAGAMVLAEPALSAGPSAGAPSPKAPGVVAPGAGTPPVVAPQLPVLVPALPMTGAPHGFPSGGNIPPPGNPLSNVDVTVVVSGGTSTKLQTDRMGNFTFHLDSTPTGPDDIELSGTSLEHAIGASHSNDGGAKGPANIIGILIALLLPPVQPPHTADNPGTNTWSGPILVQHEFSHATPNQGVHIKFTVGKNGAAMTIDWGDGAPVMDIGRQGKRLDSQSETASLVGSWGVDRSESHRYIGHVTLVK
jgi:hypothetical protein